MRFDGTLKSWNAERGFGFIAPRTGGQDIFIHVSAFPRDGRAPREGEVLTFEVETTAEGKKRATRVQRPRVRCSHGLRARLPLAGPAAPRSAAAQASAVDSSR